MFTIALIGGDGAGKTTIANRLIDTLQVRVKLIYMGQSVMSGNVSLPTTKFARFVKQQIRKKTGENYSGESNPDDVTSNDIHYDYQQRNFLWQIARFINRILDTIWRQILTFYYLIRGYIVIFDRYILFDAAPKKMSKIKMKNFLDYFEYITLRYFFPKPNLVIFLDAPPEVLYSRKGESSIKHLQSKRKTILREGKHVKNFVRVDASLPIDQVLDEVRAHILEYQESRYSEKRHSKSRD